MNAANHTSKRRKIYKPYMTGSVRSGYAFKRGAKILGYHAVFVFLFLIIGSALTFSNPFLRIFSNLALIAACGALLYMDGAKHGEADVAYAEIALQHAERGLHVSSQEKAHCFHPLKGLYSVFTGMLPIVVLAAINAWFAKLQTFSLGVLPSWVSAYGHRASIGQALAYYNRDVRVGILDIIRIIVRLLIYPFVNMAGTDNNMTLLLVDRISPVLVIVIPLLYAVGYLQGKNIRAMVHGSISTNARKRRNKLLKSRKTQKIKTQEII